MPPDDTLSLPFVTREMLKFEHGAAFALEVKSKSNVVENILITGITREGQFIFRFTTNGNGLIETFSFRLPDIPIYISTDDDGSAIEPGTVFLAISLTVNETVLYQLASGYVSNMHHFAWPMQRLEFFHPGGGLFQIISGTNPGDGNEIDETVSNGELWILKSVSLTLTTDANSANRKVLLHARNITLNLMSAPSNTIQLASTTKNYTWAHYGGVNDTNQLDTLLVGLPQDYPILAGMSIETETENIQAGDAYTNIRFVVEKFVE